MLKISTQMLLISVDIFSKHAIMVETTLIQVNILHVENEIYTYQSIIATIVANTD